MDYKAFYAEIVDWINQCNQRAATHGIESDLFWKWVTQSMGEIGNKYGNTKLVVKQMSMLFEWLEDIYRESKVRSVENAHNTGQS